MSSIGINTERRSDSHSDLLQPIKANRNSSRVLMFVVMACTWLIAAFIFSLPNREGPTSVQGMDVVAQGKLISRMGSLVLLAMVNLVLIRQRTFSEILPRFTGYFAFALWSAASVTWSCLPEVSAGQVFSFVVMLLLAFAVAQLVRTKADLRLILLSLNCLMLVRASAMVMLYFFVGSFAVSREHESFIHSTEAAETAAPALVLLIASVACLRDRWISLLLLPGVAIYMTLFVIAQNRLSLVATPLVIGLILMTTGNRRMIVILVFAGCLLLPAYMLMDPGLEMVSQSLGSTEEYAMRNDDSGQTFSTLSGRTDMWAAVWEEYVKSPLRGHGYFVTSSTGELDVWENVRNYTAHNQLLQVLSTTGIIGLGLFAIAIWLPFTLVLRGLKSSGDRKGLAMVAFFVILWFALWSTLNSSFSGALGSGSLIAYTMLGLIIGGLTKSGLRTE